MTAEETLAGLYESHFGTAPHTITKLAGAGSSRTYFRITGKVDDANQHSVIGTAGNNFAENRAFVNLAKHFKGKGLNVPEVICTSADGMFYLQTDLGDISLFDALASSRAAGTFDADATAKLGATMKLMARIQYEGGADAPWEVCFPQQAMDSRTIRWDCNYFKYCFLKQTGIDIPEPQLEDEFDRLHATLIDRATEAQFFMARDFQSRNVMWHNGQPWLIDFQGGRRGPAEYDVASFLWQAKAAYPCDVRSNLIECYVSAAKNVNPAFNEDKFRRSLPYFVLFRMLQTLGAYGFRGLTERKPHFLSSIPTAINNLLAHLSDTGLASDFPNIASSVNNALESPVVKEIRALYSLPKFNGLTITVTSFSYKRGIPLDFSGNGGGFVFDCRAIHNPGRYERYKRLTGRDEPVKRFLEEDGEIFGFLDNAYALADASIDRYLKRGFSSLCINFGCTGGQHRSVYSAEAMAHHIAATFQSARIVLYHREQDITTIIDPSE